MKKQAKVIKIISEYAELQYCAAHKNVGIVTHYKRGSVPM